MLAVLASAIFICADRFDRGGSHDDYYFNHPERISGDVPPQPYLDLRRTEIVKRVVAAEVLRRAFMQQGNQPEHTANSTHGAFGKAAEWKGQYRDGIKSWLEASGEVRDVVDRFCAFAPLQDGGNDEIEQYCRVELCDQITRVVEDSRYIQDELSNRLATAGLLPMFGFPTRVRNLYHQHVNSLQDCSVSDRPLDHAVWSFSPGSEIPKDKQLHTACGFGLPQKSYGKIKWDDDPLGKPLLYSKCIDPDCASIMHGVNEECGVCGQQAEEFKLFQPKGFVTSKSPRDYDGQRQRGPAISSPQLAFQPDYSSAICVGPAKLVLTDKKPITLVNDNNGKMFSFYQKYNFVAVPDESLYRELPIELHGNGTPFETGAIGTVFTTDVLSMVISSANGVGNNGALDIEQPSTRAAIASFGEFLKLAAATYLDIDPIEIRVGRQRIRLEECVTEQLFMADALENGAGYMRRIYDKDRFTAIIKEYYESVKPSWEASQHADCDLSCPDCLRNYGNRMEHHLLDWRLALDLAEIELGKPLNEERWLGNSEKVARNFAELCSKSGLPVTVDNNGELTALVLGEQRALILGHPLWHQREGLATDRQLNTKYELEGRYGVGIHCDFIDIRELVIRPQKFILMLGPDQ